MYFTNQKGKLVYKDSSRMYKVRELFAPQNFFSFAFGYASYNHSTGGGHPECTLYLYSDLNDLTTIPLNEYQLELLCRGLWILGAGVHGKASKHAVDPFPVLVCSVDESFSLNSKYHPVQIDLDKIMKVRDADDIDNNSIDFWHELGIDVNQKVSNIVKVELEFIFHFDDENSEPICCVFELPMPVLPIIEKTLGISYDPAGRIPNPCKNDVDTMADYVDAVLSTSPEDVFPWLAGKNYRNVS